LGAALLWNVLYRVQQGISLNFLGDVWQDNIISVFASPIEPGTYLAGAMAWTGLYLIVQVTIMALLAFTVFQFGLLSLGLALVPFMAALIMFGVAMALVVLGIVLRVGHGANEMAWALVGVVQPLAAVYYPVSILPEWGRWIAAVLPPAHIFEGMRAVVAGEPAPWEHLAAAFALNAAYLVVAIWFVKRMLAFLRARGLVTRYA
jgi:ABC-2 type transport system permease protein